MVTTVGISRDGSGAGKTSRTFADRALGGGIIHTFTKGNHHTLTLNVPSDKAEEALTAHPESSGFTITRTGDSIEIIPIHQTCE